MGVACIFLGQSYWIQCFLKAQLMIWGKSKSSVYAIYKFNQTEQRNNILKMWPFSKPVEELQDGDIGFSSLPLSSTVGVK